MISKCEDVKINDSDIVAGWLYNQLIKDYKEYDTIQKVYIATLKAKVDSLNEVLKEITDKKTYKIIKKYEAQKIHLKSCMEKIKSLQEFNNLLISKIYIYDQANKNTSVIF